MKKVRIYDLSRELKRENKDILQICSELNIEVKSHSSSVTESQAKEIKQAVQKDSPTTSSLKKQPQSNGSTKEVKNKSTSNLKSKSIKKPEILGVYKNNSSTNSDSANSSSSVLFY